MVRYLIEFSTSALKKLLCLPHRHSGNRASSAAFIWAAIACITLALLMRMLIHICILCQEPSRMIAIDSPSYLDPARSILQNHCFYSSPAKDALPELNRTPLYPVYIATIFACFGEHISEVIVGQFFMNIIVIILVGWLANAMWGNRAALISMCLMGFDLATIENANTVLSESIFTLFLFAGLICFFMVLKMARRARLYGFLFSVSFAAAVLSRPIGYFLFFPLVIWLIAIVWSRRTTARSFSMICLLLAPFVICVGGWQMRNYLVAGTAKVCTIGNLSLGLYRGAGVLTELEHISLNEAQIKISERAGVLADMSPLERGERLAIAGRRLIRQHPLIYAKISLKGLFWFWGTSGRWLRVLITGSADGAGPIGDLRLLPMPEYAKKWILGKPWWLLLLVFESLLLIAQYLGALYGIINSLKTSTTYRQMHYACLCILLYFWIISAGPECYSRFRIPIVPILALYAGGGLAYIFKRKPSTRVNGDV